MASVQYLREFINERLTAAAEQIFLEFEKTKRSTVSADCWISPGNPKSSCTGQTSHSSMSVRRRRRRFSLSSSSVTRRGAPVWIRRNQKLHRLKGNRRNRGAAGSRAAERSLHVHCYLHSTYKLCERLSHVSAPLCHRRGKKSVKCDVCGKAFQHRSRMIKHRRIHTGVKPYACQTCGKGFVRNVKLALHMGTHTGQRAYTCGTCGERFIQSTMLKTHMRSHTGETLDCKTCGGCFSQKSHLLRHMKIHTRKTMPA